MIITPMKIIKRGIPIIKWSKNYNIDIAIADLVAGITIGLTLIPQVIAYASLAGLGPQYGLYASLCGGIVYAIFGGVPEVNIAPTALLSLLTFSFTHNVTYGNVSAAILLCFLSGIIELICGCLHLGFLVDFVSLPVVAAFTSAGAITIASSQVKNLLGLHFEAESFVSVWGNVFSHISETRKWDALLGLTCCVILLLMRKLKDFGVPPLNDGSEIDSSKTSQVKKVIWFCSVGRNAFVVIGCAVTAYIFDIYNSKPFQLTSQVPEGLPAFRLPTAPVQKGNETVSTIEMIQELGAGIVVLPLIAILSNVAIAKAFSKGKVIDASQEMIAVGMCNLLGSFLGAYPISASFSRGAVSNASGVKTPIAGFYTGAMVILALTFLTPYFPYIPKATLSAVIICAVIFMVEVALTKMMWKINKIDLIPFIITLISCLFLGIEIGILVGVCVDLVFLLHTTARPKVLIEQITNENSVDYIKVTPSSTILFPSAEFVREEILKTNEKYTHFYKFVVVDCQKINKLDFTAAKCFAAFVQDFKKVGKTVIFFQPHKNVAKILESATDENVQICNSTNDLNDALKDQNRLTSVTTNHSLSQPNINGRKDASDSSNSTTQL